MEGCPATHVPGALLQHWLVTEHLALVCHQLSTRAFHSADLYGAADLSLRTRLYNKEAKRRAGRSMELEWVVRGGEAKHDKLQDGYTRHDAVQAVYGFSVQYAAGRDLDELALAGQFPNPQISYAYDDELAAALLPLGYAMRLVPTVSKSDAI
jgi:hypothetical protein